MAVVMKRQEVMRRVQRRLGVGLAQMSAAGIELSTPSITPVMIVFFFIFFLLGFFLYASIFALIG